MRYSIPATVTRVFQRERRAHISGHGADAIFESRGLGWYVRLDDQVSICLGQDKPDLVEGDRVNVILEKR